MDRSTFIRSLGLVGAYTLTGMTNIDLNRLASRLNNSARMPVIFVGHGNPMNAIEDNAFSRTWAQMGKDFQPSVILCISAHWETKGTFVTGEAHPKTIHDFGGFPQALFDAQYPAPGSPETAELISESIQSPEVQSTDRWGLDHGTWSVLIRMFPEANIPVLQMSLDRNLSPKQMYDLGRQLSFLRKKGVLIIGSGNIVHNLRMAKWGDDPEPYDWAIEFDQQVTGLIDQREHTKLLDYRNLGEAANLSIPTAEHYLPMLYTLGLQETKEEVHYFNTDMAFGSGSMRSFIIS